MRMIVVAAALFFAGCNATQSEISVEKPSVTVQILDFDGLERLIASHRGKVVVVDAWSTSCEPCIRDFHHLVELHKKYGPDRVACISLSLDYEGIGRPEDQQARVLKFLTEQRATFDNVMSNLDSEKLYRKLELASVPAVFVYDREGKLHTRFDNSRADAPPYTYDDVAAVVDKLLAAPQ